jgi:hypothetical protein
MDPDPGGQKTSGSGTLSSCIPNPTQSTRGLFFKMKEAVKKIWIKKKLKLQFKI